MAEPIDSRLIYEILKDVQARLAHLEGIRDEMREGFASIRAHMATQRSWSAGSSNSSGIWSASSGASSWSTNLANPDPRR